MSTRAMSTRGSASSLKSTWLGMTSGAWSKLASKRSPLAVSRPLQSGLKGMWILYSSETGATCSTTSIRPAPGRTRAVRPPYEGRRRSRSPKSVASRRCRACATAVLAIVQRVPSMWSGNTDAPAAMPIPCGTGSPSSSDAPTSRVIRRRARRWPSTVDSASRGFTMLPGATTTSAAHPPEGRSSVASAPLRCTVAAAPGATFRTRPVTRRTPALTKSPSAGSSMKRSPPLPGGPASHATLGPLARTLPARFFGKVTKRPQYRCPPISRRTSSAETGPVIGRYAPPFAVTESLPAFSTTFRTPPALPSLSV